MNEDFLSVHEMRRRAPLGYLAKADNARFTAYLLAKALTPECLSTAARSVGYHGTHFIALGEAFRREAAISLELLVKAVIASKLQNRVAPRNVTRVRLTHDLPALWADAGLPALSKEDRRRLLKVKQILTWSGRYSAPRTDEQVDKERAEEDVLKQPTPTSGLRVEKFLSFDWEDFDRLYSLAFREMRFR